MSASPGVERPKFPRYAWISILAISGLYACCSLHLPVGVLAYAAHDDAWFFDKARTLVALQWFGPFSQMTLIKGPGYSFFLALNNLLGLPVTLSQALLYAFACGLFSHAVFRLSRSVGLSLAVFVLMLWHPFLLSFRVLRDDIYGAESLIYLGCLIQLLLVPLSAAERKVWAIAAGLALAWLWMTREEGVWVIPATVILCAAGLWRDRRLARPVAVFVGSAVLAWSAVATGNLIAYHTFTVIDFKDRPYVSALDALQSVRVGEPIAFVPVPAKVRARIYAVSPAFATLKPYFEGGDGRGWTQPGCSVYPSTCGDIAGGWFIWALRDAVVWAGHYGSAADAGAFYDHITGEVKAGCRSGRLRCVSGPIAFMPAITGAQWRMLPEKLRVLGGILGAHAAVALPPASGGDAPRLDEMWRFEGLPRRTGAPSDPAERIEGWFYAKSNAWLQVRCSDQWADIISPVGRLPSPDVAAAFNDPAAVDRRFAVASPLEDGLCRFQRAGARVSDPGVAFDPVLAGRRTPQGGDTLFIDHYRVSMRTIDDRRAHRAEAVLSVLYKALMPALALGAGLAYLTHFWLLARGRRRMDNYGLMIHALWLFAICRLAILVLVDLSSFPAINLLYVPATLPIVCAALLLTLYMPFHKTDRARTAL